MFPARKVMTTTVVKVRPEATVDEACEQMLRHHVSGLMVTDAKDRLIGVISEADLLELMYDPHAEKDRVADYMTRDVLAVREDDPLTVAADIFLAHSVRRLPVVSEGRVVGVISRRDLIRFIRDVRLRVANGLAEKIPVKTRTATRTETVATS